MSSTSAEAIGCMELWATGNHEACILACMLLDPAALTVWKKSAGKRPAAPKGAR